MKISTLVLIVVSVNVAQAEVYKCPGKVERQYTYQARPCKGAKAEEHTIKIVPTDTKKIAEAQAKLARELDAEKNQLIKEPPTESSLELNNQGESAEKYQPTNSNENTSRANAKEAVTIPIPATPYENSTPVTPAAQVSKPPATPAVVTPKMPASK